jgi:hypothetical protein
MNAPAPIAQYDELPLATIAPSSTHIQSLRRKHFHAQALDELAASFADAGILQPLVVRPHPSPSARVKYEIVAGERRYHAAGLAARDRAGRRARAHRRAGARDPADREPAARRAHRARGGRGLPRAHAARRAIKAEDLAPIVGKSRSWVYSRLNLLTLEGDARAALEDGRLDVSRALVVATVAQPNQRAAALALALETGYNGKPTYSVRELRHKIVAEKLSMPLVGAPFDPADATLFPRRRRLRPAARGAPATATPRRSIQTSVPTSPASTLKVKAAGERKRAAVVEAGGKVLKGEDARKLSPSVNTVYGHVDLDAICEARRLPRGGAEAAERRRPLVRRVGEEPSDARLVRAREASGSRAPTARSSPGRNSRPS